MPKVRLNEDGRVELAANTVDRAIRPIASEASIRHGKMGVIASV
jgi:hypothetical protein